MAHVRISTLVVSYATEQKLLHKHHIGVDDLEDSVVDKMGLRCTWEDRPERGERLLVEATIRNRRALVVLYPTDVADEWNVGSAYFI